MRLMTVKVMVLIILGMFISTSVLASESGIQLAALNNNVLSATEYMDEDPDEEIGSTVVHHFENRLGAYSREDGSMAGAYGDGEYGE